MKTTIKLLIAIILPISSMSLAAQEGCSTLQEVSPAHVQLAKIVSLVAEKMSDEEQVTLEAATTYLASIGYGTDFQENELNLFITKLTPVCENAGTDDKFRSTACTRLSGLHAKMAQKLKMSGISNGKNAFKYLKISLALDSTNKDAIVGHAMAISELYNQGYFIRKIVESTLEANFVDEAKYAKANLERVNLTRHPLYKRISEIN